MKKKILLIMTALLISVTVLVGCVNKPPHKILSTPWLNEETATYKVKRAIYGDEKKTTEKTTYIEGEAIITTKRYASLEGNPQTVIIGDKTLENFNGNVVESNMTMADGSYLIEKVAFNAGMIPVASYKKIYTKGYEFNSLKEDTEQEITSVYENKKYIYKAIDNGAQKNGEIKLKKWDSSPYFDSSMIYHVIRSSFYGNSYTAISFQLPSWKDRELKNITTQLIHANVEFENMLGQEKLSCQNISVTMNQELLGTGKPILVWISNKPIMNSEKNRVLVQVEEGDFLYTLTNINSVN